MIIATRNKKNAWNNLTSKSLYSHQYGCVFFQITDAKLCNYYILGNVGTDKSSKNVTTESSQQSFWHYLIIRLFCLKLLQAFFKEAIDDMAARSLRCVAIAYRSYELDQIPSNEEDLNQWSLPENELVLLAIVGIKVKRKCRFSCYIALT